MSRIRRRGFPGSPNTHIPPLKLDTDEYAAVYYVTALMHHLRFLWPNRATFPSKVILQHCDDVDAVFQRVIYHPDLVLFQLLIGP